MLRFTNRCDVRVQLQKQKMRQWNVPLVWIKTEVEVSGEDLSFGWSRAYVGSSADIIIFWEKMNWHEKDFCKANNDELQIVDVGEYLKDIQITGKYYAIGEEIYWRMSWEWFPQEKKTIESILTIVDRTRNQKKKLTIV